MMATEPDAYTQCRQCIVRNDTMALHDHGCEKNLKYLGKRVYAIFSSDAAPQHPPGFW